MNFLKHFSWLIVILSQANILLPLVLPVAGLQGGPVSLGQPLLGLSAEEPVLEAEAPQAHPGQLEARGESHVTTE